MEKKTLRPQLKKVLYVCANGYLGGAERLLLSAAKGHLASSRIAPSILFFKDGEAVSEARRLGIPCIVLKTPFKLSHPRNLFKALIEIRGLIQTLRPELLHHTMAYTHLVTSLATLRVPTKKVWFQHGPVGGTLDKMASLFAVDVMFYNSEYLKRLHHQSSPHSKISQGEIVIRPSVDVIHLQRHLFNNPVITFGMAGRICKGKSFYPVIEMLAQIGSPFKLLIAGGPKSSHDEIYFQELQLLTKRLNITQEVSFLGHTEDMGQFYQSVDVFIHASETPEPFGLVIAEAMGHGCLTIGAATGGAKDFLINGKTALTYSSMQDLKQVLNLLIEARSHEKFKTIAQEGQKLILKDYSSQQMINKIENCYCELLS